jgi:hypothetical protein
MPLVNISAKQATATTRFSALKPRGAVGVGSPVLEPSRVAWNRRPARQLARAFPPLVCFWPWPGPPHLPHATRPQPPLAGRLPNRAAAAASARARAGADRPTWQPGAGAAACRRTRPAPTSTPSSGSAGSAPTPSSGAPTGGSPWYVPESELWH